MAFTERYVTAAAGGGGDGSSGNPWTLLEAFANAVSGDRVNIQSDGAYNIAGGTVSNAGTFLNGICFRGYNSSTGDLDNQGRNSDSSLNTTNFPIITTTASIVPSTSSIWQNLVLTGSFNGGILSSGSSDSVITVNCKIENTGSFTGARAFLSDNNPVGINSDYICTQATHNTVVEGDADFIFIGCRFIGNSNSATLFQGQFGDLNSCTFDGGSSAIGVNCEFFGTRYSIINCTFYGLGTAISTPNASQSNNFLIINSHVTDCGTYIDNPYSATADHNIIELNNRTRDNTTARIGINGESVRSGEVTTDTGGQETDYVDAPNGNLILISSAPGVDSGLGIG